MSIADQLIAKGDARAKAEGIWIGKVQVLEGMLGLDQRALEELSSLSAEALEARFEELQNTYLAPGSRSLVR